MKQDDIKVGGVYWAKVGARRKQVEVVEVVQWPAFASRRARIAFRVKRVDTGKLLPNTRAASALHATERG